jgi:hypothetical protein
MENAFAIFSLMILSFLLGCAITYSLFWYKCFERRSRRSTTGQQPFLNEGLNYLQDRRSRENTSIAALPTHTHIAPSLPPSAPSLTSSFPSVPNNRQNEYLFPNVPENMVALTHG